MILRVFNYLCSTFIIIGFGSILECYTYDDESKDSLNMTSHWSSGILPTIIRNEWKGNLANVNYNNVLLSKHFVEQDKTEKQYNDNIKENMLLKYDFVENMYDQVAAVEIKFSFSLLNLTKIGQSNFSTHLYLGQFNSNLDREDISYIKCNILQNGIIQFASIQLLALANFEGDHTLSIYVNGYGKDAKEVSYISPDGNESHILPSESVAYWLDNQQAKFGENQKGHTHLENNNNNEPNSDIKIGRFGIMSENEFHGLDNISTDSLRISTLYPISPVYLSGVDGKLQYSTYSNEGSNKKLNTVPDFSSCGFLGGGIAIPFISASITIVSSLMYYFYSLSF